MDQRTAAIVDDDPSVRRGLARLLRALDWDVSVYASAEEFLASDRGLRVAVMLIDVHLPGMNGVELMRRVASAGSPIRMVLMTAHGEQETFDLLRSAEGTVCLRKPFTKEAVLSAIV